MSVEFRLFGDIEASVGDRPVAVGYAQLRCLLAVLLTEVNRTVSVDQLVDRVWGRRRLPRRPRGAVQHGVTQLRRALVAAPEVTISWRGTGYRLSADPDTIDLHRFRALVDRARRTADDDRAVAWFEQALALWRGEPFSGMDTPWLSAERATLLNERHAALLDLTDAQLRLGRHSGLLAMLTEQTTRYPLDERGAEQYMLALYRCGRQADALVHYDTVRRRLADELGATPGRALRELHQRILVADPALAVATPAPTTAPRQLPAPPWPFAGRTRELARLTAVLDEAGEQSGGMVVWVISGAGGIGKTWLALHWVHRRLDRFPDGQLHVDLHGFDPNREPVTAGAALRGFLDALGENTATAPDRLDEQAAARYRSLVAGKRMLVMLDNATDVAQVVPLLPGSPSCVVLITSRNRLPGLIARHGARLLDLDVLTDAEARELLTRHLGADRVDAEPDAATELLAYCRGLPLAISVVAARAAGHLPLARLAGELRAAATRLDALDTGDPASAVRAVLACSLHAQTPEAATVFALLGLAPGNDIGLPAAAALTATHALEPLRALEHANLVQQHTPGRYRMHDLVRLYAAERARHDLSPRTLDEAARRLVDFYLHTGHAGARLLPSPLPPPEPEPAAAEVMPERLPDEGAALSWFDVEHANLLAAQRLAAEHGWHGAVWHLASVLAPFHLRRGHQHEHVEVWLAGLDAARRLPDPRRLAAAHGWLGHAYTRVGRHPDALRQLTEALAVAERIGDPAGQALTHVMLAWAWGQHGDDQRALTHADRALRLCESLTRPALRAWIVTALGWYQARVGKAADARDSAESILAMGREHRDPEAEASALDILGHTAHRAGHHAEAVDHYRQAVSLRRELGSTYLAADTLTRLGEAHAALGQPDHARLAWDQAITLYQAQQRETDADQLRLRRDTLRLPEG